MRNHESRNLRFPGAALACLLAACLAGCTGEGQLESEPEHTSSEQERGDADITRLVVTYPTLPNSVVSDLEAVTEKVNEITAEEIGVEVEFRLVDTADAVTEYPLWISREEQIDLMLLYDQDVVTYISRGMLQPLDGLITEWGPGISVLMEEGCYVTEGSVVKGQSYGVAAVPEIAGNGTGCGFRFRCLRKPAFPMKRNISTAGLNFQIFLLSVRNCIRRPMPWGRLPQAIPPLLFPITAVI